MDHQYNCKHIEQKIILALMGQTFIISLLDILDFSTVLIEHAGLCGHSYNYKNILNGGYQLSMCVPFEIQPRVKKKSSVIKVSREQWSVCFRVNSGKARWWIRRANKLIPMFNDYYNTGI